MSEKRWPAPLMTKEKCDQCDDPSASFIGPERKPWAHFCVKHGTAFTKANVVKRGRIIESIQRRKTGRAMSVGR
jgi:hypothetical protein